LSFAQFEREVIGERIRDKIAASKKKGMWMGGVPPLGYRVQDRKLVIVDSEAEIVRSIFRRYAELGGAGDFPFHSRRVSSACRKGLVTIAGHGGRTRAPSVLSPFAAAPKLRIGRSTLQAACVGVQPRHLMGWIDGKSVWLDRPSSADVFVGRAAVHGLEPATEFAGGDEVVDVAAAWADQHRTACLLATATAATSWLWRARRRTKTACSGLAALAAAAPARRAYLEM
jgi:hypothetical protein